jgi:hypothetical protein
LVFGGAWLFLPWLVFSVLISLWVYKSAFCENGLYATVMIIYWWNP